MKLASAVQRLATWVIDQAGAFGMTLGGVHWKAGCGAGDLAWPDPRPLRETITPDEFADELAAVIAGCCDALEAQRFYGLFDGKAWLTYSHLNDQVSNDPCVFRSESAAAAFAEAYSPRFKPTPITPS